MIDGQTTSSEMTTDSHLMPSSTSCTTDTNVELGLNKYRQMISDFNFRKFYELTANEEDEIHYYEITDDISFTLYIAESRRYKCPKFKIKIAREEIEALFFTGCEMSTLNEDLYNKLRHKVLNVQSYRRNT
jgi:hypothetical protein